MSLFSPLSDYSHQPGRRRKIKCRFNNDNDTTCVGCLARDSRCISQEYTHESAPAPDRRLAHRLGRLEELMEKLVDQTTTAQPSTTLQTPTPDNDKLPSPPDSDTVQQHVPNYGLFERQGTDVFEVSAAGNAQRVTILGSGDANLRDLTPHKTHPPCVRTPARVAKFESVSRQLHALFPSQQTRFALSQHSPGAKYVLSAFHSHQDQLDGKPEPISSLTQVPDIKSHPALLAKRLLQLAVCLQQIPPCFDMSQLQLEKDPVETMEEWVSAAASLVTCDDDFIGCIEGLQCLILQSFYQNDAGQLRKAWMTSRRALNMAQLMGIDRNTAPSIRSCDPSLDPKRRPSPAVLWFRINCSDRYLSLVLGLSIGSRDNSWATEPHPNDSPHDKLGKAYAVISGRIADRNDLTGSEAYALTQSIDAELEKAAKLMDQMWWELPDMATVCSASENYFEESSAMKLHIRHFSLMILLHLPYLLRDREQRRYEYNRSVCMQASREVLARFLDYRSCFTTAVSGRQVDYSALVAAMTLLLGHLGRRWHGYEAQREADRSLSERVQAKMHEIGVANGDRLCAEAADTIRELLPIVAGGQEGERSMQLNIPFLGIVNIGPPPPEEPLNNVSTTPAITNRIYPESNNIPNPPFSFEPPAASQAQMPQQVNDQAATNYVDNEMFDFSAADWPAFTADVEDWALQGVDTTYWNMLNNSIT